MAKALVVKDGVLVPISAASSKVAALSVVNGVVCTKATQLSGDGWYQIEAAAPIDEPYLKEYGWQCSVEDGTTELYKWIYRCLKEGFSVPYRTIVLGGQEHRFATELTEHDREWVLDAIKQVTAAKLDPFEFIAINSGDVKEATWFCLPIVQFGDVEKDVLEHEFERVRLDNPVLSAPPISNVKYVEKDGRIEYAYFVYRTEATAERLMKLLDKAKKSIDKYITINDLDPNDPKFEYYDKCAVAEIIHDYIIQHNFPASITDPKLLPVPKPEYTELYLQPTLYAAVAPDKNALCDGYTQAFNYFARLYGINSIAMSANVSHVVDGVATSVGGHIWNVVNLGTKGNVPAYGDYSTDPADWSPIDVYWDEPIHERHIRPERTDIPNSTILWEYFGEPDNVFKKDDYLRYIKYSNAYGRYPFGEVDGIEQYPSAKIGMWNGEENYEWED